MQIRLQLYTHFDNHGLFVALPASSGSELYLSPLYPMPRQVSKVGLIGDEAADLAPSDKH